MHRKSTRSRIQTMCEVAIMAAAGFVLDLLSSALCKGLFPNGGSISIAMVAVFMISYRRGFIPGLITGFIISALNMMTGLYVIASNPFMVFLQILLDYVVAFPLAAFAGHTRKSFFAAQGKGEKALWLTIGTVAGGVLKFLSHFLSGLLFWTSDPNEFAWNLTWMKPWVYSVVYNGAYMLPCIILSTGVMLLLFWRAPGLFVPKDETGAKPNESPESKEEN